MFEKLKRYRLNGRTYWFAPGKAPRGAEPLATKKKPARKKAAKPKNKAAEPADK